MMSMVCYFYKKLIPWSKSDKDGPEKSENIPCPHFPHFLPCTFQFLFAINFFLLCFLCTTFSVRSENEFYNVKEVYGISIRGANSVCEDNDGFVWVSSKSGVYRFTQDDYRLYHLPYVTPDVISLKLLYRNSRLFAFSNNGQFFEYDPLYDEFEFIFDLRKLLDNTHLVVSDVLVDDENSFFIAATFGLYKYSLKAGIEILRESDHQDQFIEWYRNQYFFLGHADKLYIVNAETAKVELLATVKGNGNIRISEIYLNAGSNQLWIGTLGGAAYHYDIKFDRLMPVDLENLPVQPLLAIAAKTDSSIILGYDGYGLWELNNRGTSVINTYIEDVDNPGSLTGNGVYDIFKDSRNRLWVCTFSGGVSFMEQSAETIKTIKHQINDDNSLVNNVINDICEDSDGNIWFATDNGLSKWSVSNNTWMKLFENMSGKSNVFLSIKEDNRGQMWAATWGGGVMLLDKKTGKEIQKFPNLGEFIFDISIDSTEGIWIGGIVENIVRYDSQTEQLEEYAPQPVYIIEELSSNAFLFGCSYGLLMLDRSVGEIEILFEGYIVHDLLVLNGVVWCATSGGGLIGYNLENQDFEVFDLNHGLPSNFVNSICLVDDCILLGTENGLCRFSPITKKGVTYSSNLSLSTSSFNQDACAVLSTGELIFGTNQGALMFDPDEIVQAEAEGALFFQDVIISGRSIRDSLVYDLRNPVDSLQEIVLPHNRNTLSIELLPVGISEPQIKMSWKLKGVNDVWSKPSSNRLITFANLSGGEYELRIRMYNNSLAEVIDERSLSIIIKPAFWNTWWFYLLVVFSIVGIFYFVFRYHINLIQQLHSREKIRFFTNAAHELRTSLTLISGPFEKMKEEFGNSVKGKYYLSLANEQIKGLLNAANQLLDFQKIDEGKSQVRLQMINVVKFVQQRILMFEAYARQRNVSLSFNTGEIELHSGVDVGMLEKVIDNLLSNSIKYSHEGGNVQIELWTNRKKWFFSIQDKGIGISARGQKQLFKEFFRSDNAINSKIGGSGIGLLMVKNYTEMHDGQVYFESRENVGSTFTIEMPIRKIDGQKEVQDNVSLLPDDPNADLKLVQGLNYDTETDEKVSILIVEDNEKLRNFLEFSLNGEFNVLSAANGQEALNLILNCMPDLVVSDIMMPNMDGFELCEKLKSNYETSHIPVVLLTALTERAMQLKGLGLGADAYLTKPFDIGLLQGRIKSIIQNRKAIREKALRLIDGNNGIPLLENELNDRFVKKALETVRLNITNLEFGKDLFASEMNVSPSLLYKKIKTLTDQSPSDFIRSVRLNYALELLQKGGITVTEVSEKAGFSSIGYFSTAFKKYYGKSPTDVASSK